ncbi:MAG: aminotransferase class I/II-fold pyridoxal phosphate-dependent enzyme [Clostridia bacterium]|nr:aminotransferase class I/II-fold pyridoxal phosphate-dependent enzyme [Clostridia bacterium]
MLHFESDYIQGAHPAILENLIKTNLIAQTGYGVDCFCEDARAKIRTACGDETADVYFLVGGTQANATVIDAMLKNYEGVVAAVTGHINGHEAGAVEADGHKVLPLPHHLGKVDANELADLLATFYADDNHDHMIFPGMVYVSHPTEYGTLYSKAELTAISDICRKYNIPLFLDGARLGYALTSNGTDLDLPTIAQLCDVFYIGGTKCGALCGEAVVFPRHGAPRQFFTTVKQHGALLAKGRLLGVQFDTLFTDGLYMTICKNANMQAEKVRKALKEKGYEIFIETVTNQIFIVLENNRLKELSEKVCFGFWEKKDDNHTVMRIATSWATTDEDVEGLLGLL